MPDSAGMQLNAAGWGFLVTSWSAVIILTIFCVYRIMTAPPRDSQDEASEE